MSFESKHEVIKRAIMAEGQEIMVIIRDSQGMVETWTNAENMPEFVGNLLSKGYRHG